MFDFQVANRYKSPYGPERLQEIIQRKALKQDEPDSFSSKAAKTAKNAGKTLLTIASVAAGAALAYKNKDKLFSFIKKIPEFISKNKPHSGNSVIDVPCTEILPK